MLHVDGVAGELGYVHKSPGLESAESGPAQIQLGYTFNMGPNVGIRLVH